MRYLLLLFLLLSVSHVEAQTNIIDVCPAAGIQARGVDFQPGGIIVTAFDAESIWIYDIEANTRYPLPQTRPCNGNCHLSPDARWLIHRNPETLIFEKMRPDGTGRVPLVVDASDVRWWSGDTLLVWTADHRAYLRPEADSAAPPEMLAVRGVMTVQPGGRWGLALSQDGAGFRREMLNLEQREQRVYLTQDRPYFNAASWSPDGRYLAYVGGSAYDENAGIMGGEIFLAQPGSAIPQQITFLYDDYGAVRINGFAPGELSWSPDGTRLAFWVIELLGANPEGSTGNAVLHLLDVTTREIRRYCAFSTTEHTPNPPRIIWSPDGTHVAFGGNVPGDGKGVLLLALDVQSGQITELSDGIYPAWGQADVVAWGLR